MSFIFDRTQSHFEFSVPHYMMSVIRGNFERFSGTFNLDETNLAATSFELNIDAATINTNEPQRDNRLQTADFLDVQQFPTITLKSTNVEMVDNTHAKISVDLTIKGVTKPVTLDFQYEGKAIQPWGDVNEKFTCQGVIDRRDWNLITNPVVNTGGWMVGDHITFDFEISLVEPSAQKSPFATHA